VLQPIQQARIQNDDMVEGMKYMAFEQQYPLSENAAPEQRIALLRALRKRNMDVRAANPHIRDSFDAEYDYRIQLEEIKAQQMKAGQDRDGHGDGKPSLGPFGSRQTT
jgi:hypothetical protein